ncbi:type II toxin-antitoxin system prevent-host-death family antitoxin [Gilliamella bombicola]|uniref:type II toxin-antitoxin system prevent-host-death family antitoxin n=1 Tax=Gilliamella bombicola TaxID=1798182 RepID=UPI000B824352|nr:type II toxin-antitoxin system prevent-host-death family antitoxin [Gilliamella bombicola]
MPTKVLTAYEVKSRFGEAVLSAQASPVTVTKNGKPVLVMISMDEYQLFETMKKNHVDTQIKLGLKDIEEGRAIDADTFFKNLLKD